METQRKKTETQAGNKGERKKRAKKSEMPQEGKKMKGKHASNTRSKNDRIEEKE